MDGRDDWFIGSLYSPGLRYDQRIPDYFWRFLSYLDNSGVCDYDPHATNSGGVRIILPTNGHNWEVAPNPTYTRPGFGGCHEARFDLSWFRANPGGGLCISWTARLLHRLM